MCAEGLCTNSRVCTKSKALARNVEGKDEALPLPSLHPFCISGAPTVFGSEIIAAYPPGGALRSYDIVVTIQLLIGRRSRGRRSRGERYSSQNDDHSGQGYEFACETFQHIVLLCCE